MESKIWVGLININRRKPIKKALYTDFDMEEAAEAVEPNAFLVHQKHKGHSWQFHSRLKLKSSQNRIKWHKGKDVWSFPLRDIAISAVTELEISARKENKWDNKKSLAWMHNHIPQQKSLHFGAAVRILVSQTIMMSEFNSLVSNEAKFLIMKSRIEG